MKETMDDDDYGEIELSLPLQDTDSFSVGSIFVDDSLRNSQSCTHTHACDPPLDPDYSAHTHTCYHTHTRVVRCQEEEADDNIQSCGNNDKNSKQNQNASRSRRSNTLGNREAVRKYREKKKAHNAYLEEEVKKLRVMNQHLMKKLQRQAILEMEASRLRGLLVDITGKIDGELGLGK